MGRPKLTDEERAISYARKKERNKKWQEDNKEKCREQRKAYRTTPEYKERKKAYESTPDQIAKRMKRHKAYIAKPERKEKIKEHAKAYRATPDYKERMKAYCSTPDQKRKRKEREKEYRSTPDYKERMRAYSATPERAKYRKLRYSDPEYREYKINCKTYIVNLLGGIASPELIEAKRIHLQVNRLMKELKNENPK